MRDRRSEPDPALVDGHTPVQVVVPVADLLARPGGARDRQVIFGETLRVFSVVDGMAYVIADKDGYVGFVPQTALGPVQVATHRVAALATHVYAEAAFLSSSTTLAAVLIAPRFGTFQKGDAISGRFEIRSRASSIVKLAAFNAALNSS